MPRSQELTAASVYKLPAAKGTLSVRDIDILCNVPTSKHFSLHTSGCRSLHLIGCGVRLLTSIARKSHNWLQQNRREGLLGSVLVFSIAVK